MTNQKSTPGTTIALQYVGRSCVQSGVPLKSGVWYTQSAKQRVHTSLLYTKKRHTTTAQTLKSQQHSTTQRQKGNRRQEQHLTTNQRPIPSKSHDSLRSPASRVSRRTDEAEAIATAVYAVTSDAMIEDNSSGGHRRVYCAGRSPFFLPCVSALCTNGNTPGVRTQRECGDRQKGKKRASAYLRRRWSRARACRAPRRRGSRAAGGAG